MKILFICGSAEPGKDGVGDYTRSLAVELIRMGQSAGIIALQDRGIKSVEKQTQHEAEIAVPVLRLPVSMSLQDSINHAQAFLSGFKPDWVSLQYVPFSFNPKGLPFGFAKSLRSLVEKAQVHIMFHELWVGIKSNSPTSHYVYKFFQKRIARSLVANLKPEWVTTSNKVYQLALQDAGVKNEILPLFSNISYSEVEAVFVQQLFARAAINPQERAAYEIYCVFGSIFPDIKLDDTIREQAAKVQANGKKMVLLFMGRSNRLEVERLEQSFGGQITLLNLGELPAQQISSVLRNCDIAISTTPKEFIGKSGVYAVFKRHQLPVLCPFSIAIPKYKSEMEKYFSYLETRQPIEWDVSNTAKKTYDNFSMYTNI